jgi:acyl carrier protein
MSDPLRKKLDGAALEEKALEIWRRALKIEDLTVDDDFFECGGDSLLAAEVVFELEDLTGRSLEPSIVFETGTIRQLLKKMMVDYERDSQDLLPETRGHDNKTQTVGETQTRVTLPGFSSSESMIWRIKDMLHKIKSSIIARSPALAPVVPSYETFLSFQKFWISLPTVRFHILLRKKIRIFEQWLLLTGQTDDAVGLMTRNLMANTWFAVREFFMAQPGTFERWVTLKGVDHVLRAAAAKRGVILVIPHTRALFPSMHEQIAAALFDENIYLGLACLPTGVARMIFMTQRFAECRDVLSRGGAVWVAGDGMTGKEKVAPVRYGRRFPFRAGAAELAMQTGAPLVPVFPYLYTDGRIEVEFLEPLIPCLDQPRKEGVDDILRGYAEMYMDRWPGLLPGVTFRWQQNRLNDATLKNGAGGAG